MNAYRISKIHFYFLFFVVQTIDIKKYAIHLRIFFLTNDTIYSVFESCIYQLN
jgi:hypothetical protein